MKTCPLLNQAPLHEDVFIA